MKEILFDIDKVISYKNRSKAIIGKKYYFFDELNGDILCDDFSDCKVGILKEIDTHKRCCSFRNESGLYTFLYPYDETMDRYFSYEELKERWLKDPCEIFCYKDSFNDITGPIWYFNDKLKTFYIGDLVFSEDARNAGDTLIIKNLTDINGNSLIKE